MLLRMRHRCGVFGNLISISAAPVTWSLPPSWTWLHDFIALAFDHNVILSVTTLVPAAAMLLVFDGPRSKIGCYMIALEEGEQEEFFGSQVPGTLELLFWRLRVPVYVLLRMVVTHNWTADPLENGVTVMLSSNG